MGSTPSAQRTRKLPALAVALMGFGAFSLTACTSVIPTEAGPYASEPVCAQMILAIPKDLAGLQQVRTTSQAAAAWEDPSGSGITITARCGVEVPEPTTDSCVGIGEDSTEQIDWVQRFDEDAARWTFVTYGRYPALEIVVNNTASQPTVPLFEVAAAVKLAEQFSSCY